MTLGIMQPYLFPYIGYFQLIAACDKFVVHDDVQYIRQGWVNRNYILANDRRRLFVFSVRHDDHGKSINQRFYSSAFKAEARKLLRVIDQSYAKAPYYGGARALLEEVLENPLRNVAAFNTLSLRRTCRYLRIETEFVVASELAFDKSLSAEDRVIAIGKETGATQYINPIGGMELYSRERFRDNGIELSFLRPTLNYYQQLATTFYPSLSIIDVVMSCSVDDTAGMLKDYELV
jgi:hypothetical protein